MKKGFSIKCVECNEEVLIHGEFKKENDNSNVGFSIFGNYPSQSLFLYCAKCDNEVEVES